MDDVGLDPEDRPVHQSSLHGSFCDRRLMGPGLTGRVVIEDDVDPESGATLHRRMDMVDPRLTVAVLTPHAAPGPESEIPNMTSGRVTTAVSRILLPDPGGAGPAPAPDSPRDLRLAALPSAVDEAAAAFQGASIDAVAYASTTSGYAIGFDAEVTLVEGLHQRWALPVGSSCLAAVSALRAYGIGRVALVHPPWFDDEANVLGAAYFRSQGFDAVASRADSLPEDPAHVRPESILDWVSHHIGDEAEAVFLGGNGFRAAGVIERAEQRTGRLVLEANQVLLWSILAGTGTILPINGYGRLLRDGLTLPGPGGYS